MHTILRCFLRVSLVAAGLVFAVSALLMFTLFLGIWSVRAAWSRLTLRPAAPFVMPMRPRQAFRRAWRAPSRGEVIEVEARRVS